MFSLPLKEPSAAVLSWKWESPELKSTTAAFKGPAAEVNFPDRSVQPGMKETRGKFKSSTGSARVTCKETTAIEGA
jgi:hypothetical protein